MQTFEIFKEFIRKQKFLTPIVQGFGGLLRITGHSMDFKKGNSEKRILMTG